jgi:hypothetical protein
MDEAKLEWTIIFICLAYMVGLNIYCNVVANKIHTSTLIIKSCQYEPDGYTNIKFIPPLESPYRNDLRFIGDYDFQVNATYQIKYKIEYDHRWRSKHCVILLDYWKVEA